MKHKRALKMKVHAILTVVLGFGLTSCDTPRNVEFLRYGIKTNISKNHQPREERLLNQYYSFLCEEQGLHKYLESDGRKVPICNLKFVDPFWYDITYAAMNDIDRRCDAYLGWLDNRRRSHRPLQQQLNDIGTATLAIMGITSTSALSLVVVGQAFGLTSKSLDNLKNRLIWNLESSTVQALLLSRQRTFREKLKSKFVTSRNASEYYIRNYLRLCTPFTIENDVNAIVQDNSKMKKSQKNSKISNGLTDLLIP